MQFSVLKPFSYRKFSKHKMEHWPGNVLRVFWRTEKLKIVKAMFLFKAHKTAVSKLFRLQIKNKTKQNSYVFP